MNLDDLRDDGWRRLLAAARRRLERTGGQLDGTVGLRSPSEAERRVIIGISGAHRSASAGQVRLTLSSLDEWLRDAVGHGLADALAIVDSAPLRDRPGDRRREAAAREAALAAARCGRHGGAAWFEAWLAEVAADGTLTRLIRRGADEMGNAVAVLERLPAEEIPLPVLAEVAVGDTKALTGTPLAALVLRALAAWQGASAPAAAEDERALWDAAGVIVDDLASQVLVLNLPARGGIVADWLTAAAAAGLPFRLTLHQVRSAPLVPTVSTVFVCENPAVLRAAASSLGPRCAPLVCAEGVASVACRRLLTACADAGATILWRNDFDWPGLRMTAAAVQQFGARPWRMSAVDYLSIASTASGAGAAVIEGAAVGATGPSSMDAGTTAPAGALLRGAPVASPWDPELAEAMARTGRSVMEERLIPDLLGDLRGD